MERSGAAAGAAALVIASLLWGTTGTVASFLPANVSPLAIGAATMGIGGAILFLVTAPGAVRVLRDPATRRWALIGAIGVVGYPLAFYAGMRYAGVAIGNVVALGSGPVFAAALERALEGHRLSRRGTTAIGLAVLGILVLGASRLGESSTGEAPVPGVLLALLAGACYALYSYASARSLAMLPPERPSRDVMGAMFGVGAVPLLAVLALTGAALLQSWRSVGLAAYLALGPMAVAYLLFGIGLRRLRSSTATTITLLEPVVATVLAVLVVGERPGALGWVGIALILLGLGVLVTAGRGGKAPVEP